MQDRIPRKSADACRHRATLLRIRRVVDIEYTQAVAVAPVAAPEPMQEIVDPPQKTVAVMCRRCHRDFLAPAKTARFLRWCNPCRVVVSDTGFE